MLQGQPPVSTWAVTCLNQVAIQLCLAVRAYKKIIELRHLLEIAESNYKHLGGITEEDVKQKKEQLESEK